MSAWRPSLLEVTDDCRLQYMFTSFCSLLPLKVMSCKQTWAGRIYMNDTWIETILNEAFLIWIRCQLIAVWSDLINQNTCGRGLSCPPISCRPNAIYRVWPHLYVKHSPIVFKGHLTLPLLAFSSSSSQSYRRSLPQKKRHLRKTHPENVSRLTSWFESSSCCHLQHQQRSLAVKCLHMCSSFGGAQEGHTWTFIMQCVCVLHSFNCALMNIFMHMHSPHVTYRFKGVSACRRLNVAVDVFRQRSSPR